MLTVIIDFVQGYFAMNVSDKVMVLECKNRKNEVDALLASMKRYNLKAITASGDNIWLHFKAKRPRINAKGYCACSAMLTHPGNVLLASHVTAHARLDLIEAMEGLDSEQVIFGGAHLPIWGWVWPKRKTRSG